MEYTAKIDGGQGGETTIDAENIAGAMEQAESWAMEGDWDTENGTTWAAVSVENPEGETRHHKIAIDPPEPKCSHDKGHDWQAPFAIVGGSKQSPGVYGSGGGVTIHEVCMRCGCGKLTDTWAQDPSDGEQGLRSVQYREGEYEAEVEEILDGTLTALENGLVYARTVDAKLYVHESTGLDVTEYRDIRVSLSDLGYDRDEHDLTDAEQYAWWERRVSLEGRFQAIVATIFFEDRDEIAAKCGYDDWDDVTDRMDNMDDDAIMSMQAEILNA